MPDHPPSSSSAYVQETIALLGTQDPVAVLAETPDWILGRVRDLDDEMLRRPEGPGRWSLAQVLAHLADTEIAFGWRMRITLTQDRAPLHGFDENAWVTRFAYADADAMDAFRTFAALRHWNLRVWRSTTPDDIGRLAVHSERGPESLGTIRGMIAGHDLRHRRQVDRILASIA